MFHWAVIITLLASSALAQTTLRFPPEILAAKKVVVYGYAPTWSSSEQLKYEARVNALVRKWKRFQVVSDVNEADLVLVFSPSSYDSGQTVVIGSVVSEKYVPVTTLKVFHPKQRYSEIPLWTEINRGNWTFTDTTPGALKLFEKSVGAAELSGSPGSQQ